MTNNLATKVDESATSISPQPWELIEATEHHGAYIVNAYGGTICDLYAMSNPMVASVRNGGTSFPVHFDGMAANAALIVEAVNSHASLKAENKRLRFHLQKFANFADDPERPGHAMTGMRITFDQLRSARAALSERA